MLVAVAVVFGIVQTRARYFYCESLGLSAVDPCAKAALHRAPCPLSSLERAPFDCCEVLTMPSMPEGACAVGPTVPAAGVLAVLPPTEGIGKSALRRTVRGAWDGERWRGPPKFASERRAQLMVFLT